MFHAIPSDIVNIIYCMIHRNNYNTVKEQYSVLYKELRMLDGNMFHHKAYGQNDIERKVMWRYLVSDKYMHYYGIYKLSDIWKQYNHSQDRLPERYLYSRVYIR